MNTPDWQKVAQAQHGKVQGMIQTLGETAAQNGELRRALEQAHMELEEARKTIAKMEADKAEPAPEAQ